LELVQVLLERGADINVRNKDGNTPLLQALNRPDLDRLEVVQALLDGGADTNIQDNNRMSPLHFAASDGDLEFVQVLLERGADINVRNKDGDTPLISAAKVTAAMRARYYRGMNKERLSRFLEVVRVLLLVWMFGIHPSG
jgi:ankyrin repeat protein